jgi:predicted dinucleotide-binding enzyme
VDLEDITNVGSPNHRDDAEAKAKVTELVQSFGWTDIIDLGDITTVRGTEMLLPIWLRLFGALQKPVFNFKIVR